MTVFTLLCTLLGCSGDAIPTAPSGPEQNRLVNEVGIEPSGVVIAPDETQTLQAVIRSARGRNVNRNVQWSTSDESVVKIGADGTIVAGREGTATITADVNGTTATTTVDVRGTVVDIRLENLEASLLEGETRQLSATYVFENGAERQAGKVEWRSADDRIVYIDSDGRLVAQDPGQVKIHVKGRGLTIGGPATVKDASAASVEIRAPTTSLAVDETVQLWADVYDAQGKRLNERVGWSTSAASVASVDQNGLVRGKKAGSVTIKASVDGVSSTVALDVEATSGGSSAGNDSTGSSGSGSTDGGGSSGSTGDSGSGSSGSSSGSGNSETSSPGTVTDLRVVSAAANSVTLRFSQVDDGTGSPARYNVRYDLAPLGFGWGEAHTVTKGSCATPLAGTATSGTLTCTVDGLQPNTSYDFQLVAFDGTMGTGASYGGLSNVASGETDDVPTVVDVTPSSFDVDVGATRQLKATVTDVYGNALDQAVTWTSSLSSVASVSNNGAVAGNNPGHATIYATAGSERGSSKATVVAPATGGTWTPGSGGHPNEPAGFTRYFEMSFDALPPEGSRTTNLPGLQEGTVSRWFAHTSYAVEQHSDAPESSNNVMRIRFPKGLKGGYGPGKWYAEPDPTNREFSEIYVSFWFKIDEPDYFENNVVGSKLLGYFDGSHNFFGTPGGNKVDQDGDGSADYKRMTSTPIHFFQQIPGLTSNRRNQHLNLNKKLTINTWHHIEYYAVLSDIGAPNGEFHMWIDGVKIHDHRDVIFRTFQERSGFNGQHHYAPVWGGGGGKKFRDDDILIDHFYMSGVEM